MAPTAGAPPPAAGRDAAAMQLLAAEPPPAWPTLASLALLHALNRQLERGGDWDWAWISAATTGSDELRVESAHSVAELESWLTPSACSAQYAHLATENPLARAAPTHAEKVQHLTDALNQQRIAELEAMLNAEATQIRRVTRELELARSGALDRERMLNLLATVQQPPSTAASPGPATLPTAEIPPPAEPARKRLKTAPDSPAGAAPQSEETRPAAPTPIPPAAPPEPAQAAVSPAGPGPAPLPAATAPEAAPQQAVWAKTDGPAGRAAPRPAAAAETPEAPGVSRKAWKNNVLHLWQTIVNHKHGALFAQPVRKDVAPDYYAVVHRPMDLGAVKARVRDGQCGDTPEFERDVLLTFGNAIMFNGEDTLVHEMAQEILAMADREIAMYKSTEKLVAYRRNSLQLLSRSGSLGGSSGSGPVKK